MITQTADDARRYRADEEVDSAWKREPIARLRTYLIEQNEWDEQRENRPATGLRTEG